MEILQNVHSYIAYAALVILFFAVCNALLGWWGRKSFSSKKDFKLSLFALIVSHVQLLVGLLLYGVSANGFKAIQALGVGGLNAPARLLALEHPLTNVVAIALITVGWSRHKRTEESRKKFRNIAIFYGLGLVLIVSRIPWAQWLKL